MNIPLDVETAVTAIFSTYPSLTSADAAVFLQICAEDGLSLRTLAKRLDLAQSTVTRHVSALQSVTGCGEGLVVVVSSHEDGLRRTVNLTPPGQGLRASLQPQ